MVKSFFRSNIIFLIGIGIWGFVGLGFFAYTSSLHLVQWNSYPDLLNSLPQDKSNRISKKNELSMTHVLGQNCDCSKNLSDYLLSSERSLQGSETIILLTSNQAKHPISAFHLNELEKKGFTIQILDESFAQSLPNFGTPMLLISTSKKEVVYSGGYTQHKVLPQEKIYDLEILASLSGKGRTPSSLPIYGCSSQLQFKKLTLLDFNQESGSTAKKWSSK